MITFQLDLRHHHCLSILKQEHCLASLFINSETRTLFGICIIGCFIGGFTLLRLKRSSNSQKKQKRKSLRIFPFSFGCHNNNLKENDILHAYDILQDIEQQKKNHGKKVENESSISTLNTISTMMMSSFTTINEDYYEDTTSSSSNDDDENYNCRKEIQSNHTNNMKATTIQKIEMTPITSTRLSELNEYEEIYFRNVYVHNEIIEEDDNEQDDDTIHQLNLSLQKKMCNNEKKKFDNDDEESEDGWSDTETTIYDEDDNSWLIDIDLPALLNQQKSTNTATITDCNDHFNSNHIVDNLEELFQKIDDQKKKPIEYNRTRLKKQISLRKQKTIKTKSHQDIKFHANEYDSGDVSSSSSVIDPPLTPCIHTFIKRKEKYHNMKSNYWLNEMNQLSESFLSKHEEKNIINTSLDNLNVSAHTSTTIFDDEATNHSFDAFIKMTKRKLPASTNNNYINNNKGITGINYNNSTQQLHHHQHQWNMEHDNDDDRSIKTRIGGIVYSVKDIERAWIEVEFSQHLQQDDIVPLNQQILLHDPCKRNLEGSSPIRVNDTSKRQETSNVSCLRQQQNNIRYYDNIYKRYQNNDDYGIHNNNITKCEINERFEI